MAAKTLILEENDVARAFLARVVRESFSDTILVSEAGDAESARQQIKRAASESPVAEANTFKLILVDLDLPDGEAIELLHGLRSYPAIKIATTLFSDDERLFPALQGGVAGYLLKEDRFEVLVEELQKIVRGQPPLSPSLARRLLAHFGGQARAAAVDALLPFARPASPQRLLPRESQVLAYLSKGFTIREIASMLGIRWFAVNDHIKSIYRKIGAAGAIDVASLASRQGPV